MRQLVLIAALVLAACQTERAPDLEPVGEAKVAAERAACEEQGGTFAPAGKAQALTCFTTPRDAGQQCSKATDCDSACLARSRTCAPIRPLFGCQDILNSAGVRLTQCID